VLKDPGNYELYGFEELGRGQAISVETGREIITGQYSGISGFSHVMGKKDVSFKDKSREDAQPDTGAVRYANVEGETAGGRRADVHRQVPADRQETAYLNPLDH
jgi:homocitrate synthase NifV